jgi:hypothetical protein
LAYCEQVLELFRDALGDNEPFGGDFQIRAGHHNKWIACAQL